MGTNIHGIATDIGNAFSTAWQGISAAGTTLWGSLKADCGAAFSAISSQITNGDWTGAFETAVLAMRAVWSDFQRFFVTAWHSTALAFMDIWQSMRRGIQSARETMAKLVGWFMKLGMTDEEKVEFDKALVDVQQADRNSMEQGFVASKKRHEQAIANAETSNVSIREKLAEHTQKVQTEAAAKREQELAEQATQEAMDAAQKEETATAAAGTDTVPDLGTAQIPAFEAVAIPQSVRPTANRCFRTVKMVRAALLALIFRRVSQV